MRRYIPIILMANPLLLGACTNLDTERHLASTEMVASLQEEAVENAIIRQHTLYSYHFVADAPYLTELGERDLDILANHYKHAVLPNLQANNVIRNVKVYFDYDESTIQSSAQPVLDDAIAALRDNPEADLIITGHADARGSDDYNEALGDRRASSVQRYLSDKGIDGERFRAVSRGELDAIAPIGDEEGMKEDRNAHFVVAEIQNFPVSLNVRQGDASARLYESRKEAVRTFLQGQGVDTNLISILDDAAAGDGLDSRDAFLIVTVTSQETPRYGGLSVSGGSSGGN